MIDYDDRCDDEAAEAGAWNQAEQRAARYGCPFDPSLEMEEAE